MIKALIIDDEEVVRNGLKKYISWESLGISYVYTAIKISLFYHFDSNDLIELMK